MNETRERILVIEDEPAMRTVLTDCLSRRGYRIMTAPDGEEGLSRARTEKPDLVLLDLMLPRLDGFTLCRELRRLGFAGGILVLTARGQVEDRVHGLDLGADDYLVKPFCREELMARIRAVLRRRQEPADIPRTLRFGDVRVDIAAQRVWKRDVELALSPKEFAVLRLLLERAGQVISREFFLDRVWGVTAFPTTRTVDRHIVSLRRKIEDDPAAPRWIQTLHRVGYRFTIQPP
jgi:two-component system alkaline phosphatase synthesis response regulator PhoP